MDFVINKLNRKKFLFKIMADRFKLYVISTNKSLTDLYNILVGKAPNKKDIGPLRTAFVRDKNNGSYKRINKRFVLTTNDVYSGMKSSGYCDENNKEIYMLEYEIRDGDKAPLDSVMHFYYPASEDTNNDVKMKLDYLCSINLLNEEDFIVNNGIVEFKDSVDDNIRTLAKITIDTPSCRISWCKIKAWVKVKKHFNHNTTVHRIEENDRSVRFNLNDK